MYFLLCLVGWGEGCPMYCVILKWWVDCGGLYRCRCWSLHHHLPTPTSSPHNYVPLHHHAVYFLQKNTNEHLSLEHCGIRTHQGCILVQLCFFLLSLGPFYSVKSFLGGWGGGLGLCCIVFHVYEMLRKDVCTEIK